MPCGDSSSSICIRLDHDERIVSFDFAKITCGRAIDGKTEFQNYCHGKSLQEILEVSFNEVLQDLNLIDEERQFICYLEWAALRSAIAQYLGLEDEAYDKDRCRITSIEYDKEGIEIAEVILPPKELPKILPCSLSNN